jgi:hypothetical protein
MPAGTVDVSVGREWSFAQTLRHPAMATDTWLGRAILAPVEPGRRPGPGRGAGGSLGRARRSIACMNA